MSATDPMDAIRATYFQECEELLADLEQGLLTLDDGSADDEVINAVFRAVHSVKGGAGAFGFEDLVAFSHVFETALDAMRSGQISAAGEAIKVMLRASDVLADFVNAARTGAVMDAARVDAAAAELSALTDADAGAETVSDDAPSGDDWGFVPLRFDAPADDAPGAWTLTMRPRPAMYANGHDAALLIRELERLAPVQIALDASRLPSLDALDPDDSWLSWTIDIPETVNETAIRDVFDWVGEDCPIDLARAAGAAQAAIPDAAPPPLHDDASPESAATSTAPAARDEQRAPVSAGPTIRVDLERVDRLIDLVGELVINQAVLAQRVGENGLTRSSSVAMSLDELEQLTREIQDSVMAIRAQPVKSVFQRMPRLVREIAASTGKQARLVMEGESTEVDKTIIERLADPITHMLRNAIDHGLESTEARLGAGKPAEGVVRLAALHRSGRIVIEVSDDGQGINRPRVRQIAVDRGLIAADAALSDDEIDNLIFMPGFSTASSISNISGRGVGMDVVKRAIQALGGRISIASQPGRGSTFTLSLPLTLAVLDGMVVSVGEQTLVAPLSSIMETFRPKAHEVRPLGPSSWVLSARGDQVPLIDVGVVLGWRTTPIDPSCGVTLLVESEIGGKAALVVDAIRGQRQVVIKSLEANWRSVPGVAAATILGDGRVALILDVDAIIERRLDTRPDLPPLALAS